MEILWVSLLSIPILISYVFGKKSYIIKNDQVIGKIIHNSNYYIVITGHAQPMVSKELFDKVQIGDSIQKEVEIITIGTIISFENGYKVLPF